MACGFLFRSLPDGPIDAGCAFASVFRHSSNSKSFPAERVGESNVAGLSPCPICPSELPARYGLGADEQYVLA